MPLITHPDGIWAVALDDRSAEEVLGAVAQAGIPLAASMIVDAPPAEAVGSPIA